MAAAWTLTDENLPSGHKFTRDGHLPDLRRNPCRRLHRPFRHYRDPRRLLYRKPCLVCDDDYDKDHEKMTTLNSKYPRP